MILMTGDAVGLSGLAFQVAATTNAISGVLPGRCADGVAEDADRAGLHLDDVTGSQPWSSSSPEPPVAVPEPSTSPGSRVWSWAA